MIRQSESIKELAKALALAQGQMRAAVKNAKNQFGTYANLDSINDATQLPLANNGLSIVQFPSGESPITTLTTRLMHSSGEWLESSFTVSAAQNTAQSVGSLLSYLRRYCKSAILGIGTDDDDGELASKAEWLTSSGKAEQPKMQQPQSNPIPQTTTQPQQSPFKISDAQIKRMYAISKSAGVFDNDVNTYIKQTFGYNSRSEILKGAEYDRVCAWIQTKGSADPPADYIPSDERLPSVDDIPF